MFLTPHVAVGVAIGSLIPNPVLAVPLAFASHFVLDAVPHWDDIGLGKLKERRGRIPSAPFRRILLDFLLALSFVLFFVYWSMPDWGVAANISACALASILPDVYYTPLAFFGWRWGFVLWMVRLQSRIQRTAKAPRAFGLLMQAFSIAASYLLAHQQILIRLPQAWKIL